MRASFIFALIAVSMVCLARAREGPSRPLPAVTDGWSIELVAEAPKVLYPTAIVAAPDGTLYVGSDPMDMAGSATKPIDRVLAIKDGQSSAFAEKLWSVKGLEWVDGTLYVVHAPFLTAFRDTDGDGKADNRVDLMTGLGPPLPGSNGINDHIAAGIRLGMDGFLYIAVGDKGIPQGVGKDGRTIQLFGGGVIRIRPDGTDLEVVSTGECSPLSVALSATDEIFTLGREDDSKRWPNSLTHHIVGGHYGYPYQFLTAPHRALPIMAGLKGGAGAQGICYNEDGLSPEYRGNLFFCDWGNQAVLRFEIRKAGGTHAVTRRSTLVSKGNVRDFHPFSLAAAADGASLWLVDWAFDGWLADGPQTGRLYRLRPGDSHKAIPAKRPIGHDASDRIKSLDHPALSVRMESQRMLARMGPAVVAPLADRLSTSEPETGRIHALWALDAIGGIAAREAIGAVLQDPSPRVRLQAVRSAGIRRDKAFANQVVRLLGDRDAAVRREAAICLGRLADRSAGPALYAALGDADAFAAWSIRQSIRKLNAWDKEALVLALLDERRLEPALKLTDEAWSSTVLIALSEALKQTSSAPARGRIVANIAGLLHQYPEWTGTWFGTNPLSGAFPRKTKDWDPKAMKTALDGLSTGLSDRDSSVRFQAITGLAEAGQDGARRLRSALPAESDSTNQAVLVETLGTLKDAISLPLFVAVLKDAKRAVPVRLAALAALAGFRDPQSLQARLSLVYEEKAPPALVARALPDLARSGFLPPNELSSFMQNAAPEVRAAALLSLNVKKALPVDVQQSVLDRIGDPSEMVRQAAILAVAPLQLRAAIPRLLDLAQKPGSPDYTVAVEALCGLPDPRATSVYLAALADENPRLRKLATPALLAIRDQSRGALVSAARSGRLNDPAALALDWVLAKFTPIASWSVIGPFAPAAPQPFFGRAPIDFARVHAGAGGRPISWTERQGDPITGRVDLDDLERPGGELGDAPIASDEKGAFAYAEVNAPLAGPALLLVGSSGTLVVAVNEEMVYQFNNSAGRAFSPDSDVVRCSLKKGLNRILVFTRHGAGRWCFDAQIAMLPVNAGKEKPAIASSRKE
jgi:HEAT repeat protein/glucose/arabinose dehydrogenase